MLNWSLVLHGVLQMLVLVQHEIMILVRHGVLVLVRHDVLQKLVLAWHRILQMLVLVRHVDLWALILVWHWILTLVLVWHWVLRVRLNSISSGSGSSRHGRRSETRNVGSASWRRVLVGRDVGHG